MNYFTEQEQKAFNDGTLQQLTIYKLKPPSTDSI